jgi:inner membrane protein
LPRAPHARGHPSSRPRDNGARGAPDAALAVPAQPSRRVIRLLPFAAVGAVVALDAAARALSPLPVFLLGMLDEPAHLLTAVLALWAFAPAGLPVRAWLWTLLGAVLLDVDHIPMYLTDGGFAVDGGRPPTHSLLTPLVLVALGLTARRLRVLLPFALGVLLHFGRDIATGPGVALFWPLDPAAVIVPHPAYLLVLGGLAVVAAARRRQPALSRLACAGRRWPGRTSPDGDLRG